MANNAVELPSAHADTLESHSLWYKYKIAVWGRESPESAAIHNTMRTLRAIRHREPLAYVSTPITSGAIFYQLQLEQPNINKKDLMKTVMDHNFNAGWHLVDKVAARRKCNVLYPAELAPARQKWKQEDFQALWLSIIGEICTEVHMCTGWNLSNGGIEELIHVFQLRLGLPKHEDFIFYNTKSDEAVERDRMRTIALFDDKGNPITIDDAICEIEKAKIWLRRHHSLFSVEHHDNCLKTLLWTREKIKQDFYQ